MYVDCTFSSDHNAEGQLTDWIFIITDLFWKRLFYEMIHMDYVSLHLISEIVLLLHVIFPK